VRLQAGEGGHQFQQRGIADQHRVDAGLLGPGQGAGGAAELASAERDVQGQVDAHPGGMRGGDVGRQVLDREALGAAPGIEFAEAEVDGVGAGGDGGGEGGRAAGRGEDLGRRHGRGR